MVYYPEFKLAMRRHISRLVLWLVEVVSPHIDALVLVRVRFSWPMKQFSLLDQIVKLLQHCVSVYPQFITHLN